MLWTGGAEATFGYTEAEAIGMPLEAIIPPALRDAHRAGLRRVAGGAEPRLIGTGSLALEAFHRDGHVFPVELTLGRVMRGDDMLFVGVVRDDTRAPACPR